MLTTTPLVRGGVGPRPRTGPPDRIVTPLFALNFADDLPNPAQLGAMARAMPRVKKGRYVIVPEGPDTIDHQTLTQAKVWVRYLEQLMSRP